LIENTPRRRFISTGTLVVLGIGLVLLVGWFAYKPMIPPAWLHGLAADIALRAVQESNAPPPEDMRQASPAVVADSPYICVAKIITQPWDRIVVATSKQGLGAHPVLASATWPQNNRDALAATLERDERYQVLVLIKDNAVIDSHLFYTFWANLDGIARPEGFTPAEAVFTAASKDSVYIVTQAENPPPDVCR
jgi:hypothetical protein